MSTIYSALSFPIHGPSPSINNVQWSSDGQLIICSKSSVLILTPDVGINFDNHSLLKTDRKRISEVHGQELSISIGWHRNVIELSENITHPWPSETQEWGAVVLGSIEVSPRAVTISPGNLNDVSTGSGCLLVIMNSNLELTLWCATKNHLKEAWSKIQDITATLKELPCPQSEEGLPRDQIKLLKILQSQATSISWSSQARFGIHPNSLVDGSLLAIGNRAGSIILMRYDGKQGLNCICVLRISEGWITNLSWSTWRLTEVSSTQAFIACGGSNGSVVIIRVRQRLERNLTGIFGPEFSILTDTDVLNPQAWKADKRIITSLKWIERENDLSEKLQPTLFISKPGVFIHFQIQIIPQASAPLEPSSKSQGKLLATIRTKTQRTSIDSNSLSPVSGIFRIDGVDEPYIVVSLFDGSFHVIRNAWSEPAYEDSSLKDNEDVVNSEYDNQLSNNLTSASLSHSVRSVFWKTEGGMVQDKDVGRISGAVSYDNFGTVLWLYETCQPTDFSYKHDAKHNSVLVVSQLWQDPRGPNALISRLRDILDHPHTTNQQTASFQLLPILTCLSKKETYEPIYPQLLQILEVPSQDYDDGGEDLEVYSGGIDGSLRTSFRRSISRFLYGIDAIHSLRLRLIVADYGWKMASDDLRDDYGKIAMTILNNISYFYLKTIINHLIAIIDLLQEQDLPFVMRVIIQGLLEGAPEALVTKANRLNEVTRQKFSNLSSESFGLIEACPACKLPIALENIQSAVCPQGHTWTRCSITSFLLATPMLRTCTGCTRKAFLAPSSRTLQPINISNETVPSHVDISNSVPSTPLVPDTLWIPDAGRSWIVDELLEAVRSCLYCENRFVRIL